MFLHDRLLAEIVMDGCYAFRIAHSLCWKKVIML